MGDFNARIGRHCVSLPGNIGRRRVVNENENGRLLLDLCSTHQLNITNTRFQLPDKLKTT